MRSISVGLGLSIPLCEGKQYKAQCNVVLKLFSLSFVAVVLIFLQTAFKIRQEDAVFGERLQQFFHKLRVSGVRARLRTLVFV